MKIQPTWYERGWGMLKVIIFLVSCWFIWWHVDKEMQSVGDAGRLFSQLFTAGKVSLLLWIVLLLALLNWSLEAMKWKFLISKTEQVSFIKSLRAFFNGITLSFFTPNRVGEFAGRVIYLRRENTIQGALLSFIGSAAQLLITIQCGTIAAIIYIGRFLEISSGSLLLIRLALVFIFLISTWAWWKMPKLAKLSDRLNLKTSWKEKAHIWDSCTNADLLKVWMLSFFRYAVFTSQFVLLMKAVEVPASAPELVALTALSYFFITMIPSIALGELGIRGSVNLALFGYAGALPSDILPATFSLWMINLAFPALFGAASVLFLKIRKHTEGRK